MTLKNSFAKTSEFSTTKGTTSWPSPENNNERDIKKSSKITVIVVSVIAGVIVVALAWFSPYL